MKFCPLRSTAEKEVACSENCAWYFKQKDSESTCEINYLTEQLHDAAAYLDTLAANSNYNLR